MSSAFRCPNTAYGVSRYELDRLLLEHAASAGTQVVSEHWSTAAQGVTVILAAGRRCIAPAGDRLFGFKAHFSGPANDNVELYFFQDCYVGISAIENGATNVCGLAPERNLRPFGFSPRRSPPSLRPALRAPAPPHSHHGLAHHRPPRLFRAA